ncbi:hypothetical protein IWX76_001527 [Pedobacter sp. CAN_A7]
MTYITIYSLLLITQQKKQQVSSSQHIIDEIHINKSADFAQ